MRIKYILSFSVLVFISCNTEERERLKNENLELNSQIETLQTQVDSLTKKLNDMEKNIEFQKQIAIRHMEIIAKNRSENED